MQPSRVELQKYLGHFTPLHCSFKCHVAIKPTVCNVRLQKKGMGDHLLTLLETSDRKSVGSGKGFRQDGV